MDVVALPGVGLVVIDLELHVVTVADAREQEPVAEQPRRAGDTIHEVPHGHRLLRGENGPGQRVGDALGRTGRRLAGELNRAGGDIAENRHRDLAVDEHVLDVVPEVERVGPDRRPDQRGAPRAPGAAELIVETVGIEGIRCKARRRGALGDRPQRRRPRHATAHGMRLIVEDEQVRRGAGRRPRGRLEHLDGLHVEELAEYFVHGQEGRRGASRSRQELTAAQAKLLGRAIGELERSSLDALLLLGLGRGHVLAVRHDLGGNRHPVRIGLVGGRALRQLLVTQPGIFLT